MARTGEEILSSLYNNAIANGLVTARFEQGRLGLLFSVIAKEFVTFETIIENYIAEMNLSTAREVSSIELLSTPFHTRQPAKTSTATLRFTKNETITEDYVIPYGTIVETAELNPITYYTIETKTLYKENNYVDIVAFSTDAGSSTIVKEDSLVVIADNNIRGLYVTNPEPSYGGTDQEKIDRLRSSVLSFRFQLEKGTFSALNEELRDYGFEMKDFNIVENEFGYGSLSVYLDTTNDDVVDAVKLLVSTQKACGIYLTVKKVTPVPVEFDFSIQISSRNSLFPEQRNRLKAEISSIFSEFVDNVGVGKDFYLTKAIAYIYNNLSGEWALSDIQIETNTAAENIDEKGNIIVESWEAVKIEQLNIIIETE